jgi:hypothetical protein
LKKEKYGNKKFYIYTIVSINMLLEVLYCISIGCSIYNEYRFIQVMRELSSQSEKISQLTINNNEENCIN